MRGSSVRGARSGFTADSRRMLFLVLMLAVGSLSMAVLVTSAAFAEDRTQTRPSMARVEVPADRVAVGDGDTITIDWGGEDRETVRILGIDTPETQNIAHNLPYDQPFGREAAGFARGAFAMASKVEILRAAMKDPYGRTLGYIFLNDRNYSELVLAARLAEESITRYGDNGFPVEAQACIEAARAAGPLPFESPGEYRKRMRAVTDWMRSKGVLNSKD